MKQVLLMEDEEGVRTMFCAMLEKAGYEVISASNGKEGLELYHSDPTPLVITDIVMPEKEGTETIMELRRDYPNVKIIAVSGGGQVGPQTYLDAVGKLGADRMFAKPVERDTLLEAVRALMDEATVEFSDRDSE